MTGAESYDGMIDTGDLDVWTFSARAGEIISIHATELTSGSPLSPQLRLYGTGSDLPELGIRCFAGIQVLPDGNSFVCNAGGGVHSLGISPNKRVVWRSPVGMSIPLGHGV